MGSHLPSSRLPSGIPDVIPHFIEYGVLAFFFIRMFGQKINVRIFFSSLVFLLCLAALDEFHQYFVPSRFFSLKDLAVDGLGILVGIGVYIKLSSKSDAAIQVDGKKRSE